MERCRWVDPGFDRVKVYIVVNIPSFKLNLFRDGKIELESPVIVGDKVTKTVIFSGIMNQIIFSPYWNVPQSIMEEEVRPGIIKNKNYLINHHMEWNKGQVRQKPGKNNSLGLVKFLFPNSDDIYMHDTTVKILFISAILLPGWTCRARSTFMRIFIKGMKGSCNCWPLKNKPAWF